MRIHISDHNEQSDCLPPGKGGFDFKNLFSVMDSVDYCGDYIVELYREGFGSIDELTESFDYLFGL